MAVPFRNFDPDIDILYWGRRHSGTMVRLFRSAANADLVSKIRHIAFELNAAFPTDLSFGYHLNEKATSLQTLSFVLPDSRRVHNVMACITPPARRYRLVEIPDATVDRLTVTGCSDRGRTLPVEESEDNTQPLRSYMRFCHDKDLYSPSISLALLGRQCRCGMDLARGHGDTTAAARPIPDFARLQNLELKAQTFVEYRRTEEKGEEWVEVCVGRIPERPPPPDGHLSTHSHRLPRPSPWRSPEQWHARRAAPHE